MDGTYGKEEGISLLEGRQVADPLEVERVRRAFSPHVTYARNVFVPLTRVCRNRCGYCVFREAPRTKDNVMSPLEVEALVSAAQKTGAHEVLFTFGERPEHAPEVREELGDRGYTTIIDYLCDLCEDIVLTRPMLPHSNPGVMTKGDLLRLREVNASLGMMLETTSRRLMGTVAHKESPGKDPTTRLRVIRDAGKLRIPFTTGLLLGIGETPAETMDALLALRRLHDRYGHVQELIIQNFAPKQGTPMGGWPAPDEAYLLRAVTAARLLFPDVSIQIPPNLNTPRIRDAIAAGANDLGGISAVTPDYVNPEHAWPVLDELGITPTERLPVYPRYLSEEWMAPRTYEKARMLAGSDGYIR